MDKFQAFVALLNIVLNCNVICFYRFKHQQINRRFQIFKQVFLHNLPNLCNHFESLSILPEHYMIEWCMTLFSKNLNIDLVARIWDMYMIDGFLVLCQAGVVLLAHFEKRFLEYEFEDIIKEIKATITLNFDDDELVENMKQVKFPEWIVLEIQKLNDEYIPVY